MNEKAQTDTGQTGPVFVEKEKGLGWLVFNRPAKRNALNAEAWQAIPRLLRELEEDPEIRVILVRGAGEEAFCAGADIGDFEGPSGAEGREPYGEAFDAFANCSKPTVAMIHGACYGGGCAIALSVDIRLASSEAKFAITPARLGLGYPFRGVQRAVQELGPAGARYLLLTASAVNAERALAMGLIQEIHEPSRLKEAAVEVALKIAGNAPKTLRAIKESVLQSMRSASSRDVEEANRLIRDCFESEDFQEGVQAFMDGRKPEFKDR